LEQNNLTQGEKEAMGPYLGKPKIEKESIDGENDKVCFIFIHIRVDKIRSMRDAGLEKHHGRCAYM
jgi:hypothetical protein